MRRPASCDCHCTEPLWIDTRRGVECLGPLTSDTSVSGHTQDWRWDRILGSHFKNGHPADPTQGPYVFLWTWFPNPGPGLNTTTKMRPLRYALSADSINSTSNTDIYGAPPSRFQRSSFTAPATSDGHFSGSRCVSVTLGSAVFSTNLTAFRSRIIAARLIVDGVDVTGIVSMSVGTTTLNTDPSRFGQCRSNAITIPVSPEVTIASAKEMFIDLWIEHRSGTQSLSTIHSSAIFPDIASNPIASPLIAAHGTFSPYSNAGGRGPLATPGQINVHRRLKPSDTWNLTFTGGTVGGVSLLAMQAQSGWSFTRQGPVVQMVKTSGTGTGDKVLLRYDTETPEIHVQLASMLAIEINGAGGINSGWTRYSIYSPSYYLPVTQGGQSLGPVTASGSNTFSPVSRGQFGPQIWYAWEMLLAGQKTGFPTSISATRS